jgi:acyl phosphate:glycerol-3-phosphate acyltransferase
MNDVLLAVAAAFVGYLLGTFPTADLVTRLATRGTVDIRSVGSGNPGGLNAMKAAGTTWGMVVVVDVAKGAGAALLGWLIAGTPGAYAGATAGIAGHIFPVWTGFRGGKGATGTASPNCHPPTGANASNIYRARTGSTRWNTR